MIGYGLGSLLLLLSNGGSASTAGIGTPTVARVQLGAGRGKRGDMRRVNDFKTDDDRRLSAQLTELEDNAEKAISDLAGTTTERLKPTNVKTASYEAKVGEHVRMDTSDASKVLRLPVATPQNAGRLVTCYRPSAANALVATVTSGTVNDVTSFGLPNKVSLFIFVSNGTGWDVNI